MILLDTQEVKDFIELKIKYEDTNFKKMVKKYDDASGDSLLENIIFYPFSQYNLFSEGINKLVEDNDVEELEYYLMVLRGIIINSVRLEDEKYSQKLFSLFMSLNGLYNYLSTGAKKNIKTILPAVKNINLQISEIQTLK